MFWPRFQLTPFEKKQGAVKYFDYETGKRGVLRKMYQGYLTLTQIERNPTFTFQIARRCRVLGFTASGDLGQFRIQVKDTSGEEYFATPCSLASLLGGYVELPPPAYGNTTEGATGGYPPTVDDAANTLGWAFPQGEPQTYAPFIFEPAIILDSNQALQILGSSLTQYQSVNYRADITMHIWEFPSWRMGPG